MSTVHPIRDSVDVGRLPGCGIRCERRRYLHEPTQTLQWLIDHNPSAHESYGVAWALHRETTIATGPLLIDRERGRVMSHGRTLALTTRELALLICLGVRKGHVVPYTIVMDEVYGSVYGLNVLHSQLQRTRHKLGPVAARLLVTHLGIGLELLDEPVEGEH